MTFRVFAEEVHRRFHTKDRGPLRFAIPIPSSSTGGNRRPFISRWHILPLAAVRSVTLVRTGWVAGDTWNPVVLWPYTPADGRVQR